MQKNKLIIANEIGNKNVLTVSILVEGITEMKNDEFNDMMGDYDAWGNID